MGMVDMMAKPFVSKALEKYGELKDLQIDTKHKNISIEMLLKGETTNLKIDIYKYVLLQTDTGYVATAEMITTNKQWLNVLLDDYIKGKQLPIPSKYAEIIKWII